MRYRTIFIMTHVPGQTAKSPLINPIYYQTRKYLLGVLHRAHNYLGESIEKGDSECNFVTFKT